MHIWKHFSTITRHRHKKIISVIKVQMKKRGNGTAFRVRGFIIRDAINTILNTGLITIRS